jgi:hypothetical protein
MAHVPMYADQMDGMAAVMKHHAKSA